MGLLLIASLFKDRRGGLIGYRLLDTDSGSTMDVPVQSLISTIMARKAVVDNIKVDSGVIHGTNGAIERYPRCTPNNALLDKNLSPLIIINRLGDVGFTVSDFKGNIKQLKDTDVIAYAEKAGIANGKIVKSPENNQVFISAISGNYPVVSVPEHLITKIDETPQKPSIGETPVNKQETVEIVTGEPPVFTDEQKICISKYYQYYFNREAQLNRSADEAKKTSKEEVKKLEQLARSGLVIESMLVWEKFIHLAHLIGTKDELGNLTNPAYAEHFVNFLALGIPMPESMLKIFNDYLVKDINKFMLKAFSTYEVVYNINRDKFKNTWEQSPIGKIEEDIKAFPGEDESIIKMAKFLAAETLAYKAAHILEVEGKNRGLTIQNMSDAICDYKCTLTLDERCIISHLLCLVKSEDCNVNCIGYTFNKKLHAVFYGQTPVNLSNLIGKFLIDAVGICDDAEVTQPKSTENGSKSTLEDKFNIAYANHPKSTDEAEFTGGVKQDDMDATDDPDTDDTSPPWDDKPSEEIVNDTPEQLDINFTVKPDGMDIVEWAAWLIENNPTLDSNDTSIIIAKDIAKRKLKYDRLSSRQKWRVDQAVKIGEEANNKRLGITVNSDNSPKFNITKDKKAKASDKSSGKSEITDSENITYQLSDKPEIKSDVERIISKADSVEMQAVLAESPNVIKICYSILRNGKASTRQLRHVNRAIEILNNQ